MSLKNKRAQLQALNREKYTKVVNCGRYGLLKVDTRAIEYDKQFGWFKCEHCGKIFMRTMSTTRVSNNIFCSRQCRIMSDCVKRVYDEEKFNKLFNKWKPWINKKVIYFYPGCSFVEDIIQECYITLFRCCSGKIKNKDNSYIATSIYKTIKSTYGKIMKEYKNISYDAELYDYITYENNEELMDIINGLKIILSNQKLPVSVKAGFDYCAGYTIDEISKKYNLTKNIAEKKRYVASQILRRKYPQIVEYLKQ